MLLSKTPEPLQIRGNAHRAWIDFPDQSSLVLSSGAIQKAWNKMAVSNHLTQSNASARPAYGTKRGNGLLVPDFDGSKFLIFDSNDVFDEAFTIFCVGQANSNASVQGFLGRQSGSNVGTYVLRQESGNGVFNSYCFGTGGSSQAANSSNNNANIHTIYFQNGGSLGYSLNNGSFQTGAVRSGYDNSSTVSAGVGTVTGTGSFPLNGWIGEIIVYGAVLNQDEINFINRYLSKKWGIAIS